MANYSKTSPLHQQPSKILFICMGLWLGMAIIVHHQDFHASFDQEITAEITGSNCKEGVSALKLVTNHLPNILSKRVE
eukprot:3217098-Ditylum_brightwellii.AAC.1